MHGPIVLGIAGGLFGALFIWVNKKMSLLRKKIKGSIVLRVLETIILSCVTMSVCFYLAEYQGICTLRTFDKIIYGNISDPNYKDFYDN